MKSQRRQNQSRKTQQRNKNNNRRNQNKNTNNQNRSRNANNCNRKASQKSKSSTRTRRNTRSQKRLQKNSRNNRRVTRKNQRSQRQRRNKNKKSQRGGYGSWSLSDISTILPCRTQNGVSVANFDTSADAGSKICSNTLDMLVDSEFGADSAVSVISDLSDFAPGETTQVIDSVSTGDGRTMREDITLMDNLSAEAEYKIGKNGCSLSNKKRRTKRKIRRVRSKRNRKMERSELPDMLVQALIQTASRVPA